MMCPLVFTRGTLKKEPPTSPNIHPLGPFNNELSFVHSPLPGPQNNTAHQTNFNQDLNSYEDAVQHDLLPIGTEPLPSVVSTGRSLGPITAVPQPALSDPSWVGDPQNQPTAADQGQASSETTSATAGPIVRPAWWFCHVCRNGPQGIQTPSCTGMTSTGGVCGHQRCSLCTTE